MCHIRYRTGLPRYAPIVRLSTRTKQRRSNSSGSSGTGGWIGQAPVPLANLADRGQKVFSLFLACSVWPHANSLPLHLSWFSVKSLSHAGEIRYSHSNGSPSARRRKFESNKEGRKVRWSRGNIVSFDAIKIASPVIFRTRPFAWSIPSSASCACS